MHFQFDSMSAFFFYPVFILGSGFDLLLSLLAGKLLKKINQSLSNGQAIYTQPIRMRASIYLGYGVCSISVASF